MTSKTNRLFIAGLPYRYTEGQLLSLFAPFGRLVSAVIVRNRWGKSRGMGYVEYDAQDSAINAKEKMHGFLVENLTLIVDYAKPDPLTTPEGMARHEEALKRHPPRPFTPEAPRLNAVRPKSTEKTEKKQSEAVKFYKPGSSKHVRSSVFKQRHFGSQVGKKFVNKTRKKA